jgi:2-polyprenyl-3-methyl-5-hydroxy-6-metoxy-1,4-benzoquinol methylase
MDIVTRQQLLDLNRQFYETVGTAFDHTRQTAWPGWQQAWEVVAPLFAINTADNAVPLEISLLDLGCGNGRWGSFITDQLTKPVRQICFTGVDENQLLIRAAARRLLTEFSSLQLNNVSIESFVHDSSRHFDLITLYGVWHHLPGKDFRSEILSKLAKMLSPDGSLIISCWQFRRSDTLRKRLIDPVLAQPISAYRLEPGDYFLDWRSGPKAIRYCHETTTDEMQQAATQAGLQIKHMWTADGEKNHLNDYYLLTH